jgi:hypothetical protein
VRDGCDRFSWTCAAVDQIPTPQTTLWIDGRYTAVAKPWPDADVTAVNAHGDPVGRRQVSGSNELPCRVPVS